MRFCFHQFFLPLNQYCNCFCFGPWNIDSVLPKFIFLRYLVAGYFKYPLTLAALFLSFSNHFCVIFSTIQSGECALKMCLGPATGHFSCIPDKKGGKMASQKVPKQYKSYTLLMCQASTWGLVRALDTTPMSPPAPKQTKSGGHHFMAFANTPKQWKLVVMSTYKDWYLCQWAPAACPGFLRFPFGPVGA